VLSEGEYRIVSLAAFLADVGGKDFSAPFVFDDPISSLDQDFEEAVVQRLVELSQERQVIIFTHGSGVHADFPGLRVVNENIILFGAIVDARRFPVLDDALAGKGFSVANQEPDKVGLHVHEHL
jgi:ABC-type Mn2+/Zn2+ transport system ATPase subunit